MAGFVTSVGPALRGCHRFEIRRDEVLELADACRFELVGRMFFRRRRVIGFGLADVGLLGKAVSARQALRNFWKTPFYILGDARRVSRNVVYRRLAPGRQGF